MSDENKISKIEFERLKAKIPNYKPISAEGRMEICDVCPENTEIGFAKYCKECNCLLALKVRIPFTECPLKKW